MKKFFKGLALVLALTLIIGTVPVAAADSYEVKKATKTLYVDGAQGKSADGKLASKISNKVAIYKLVKGLTKADLEKCTAKIVKGDSIVVGKHGYIKAVALGKTTVEVLVDGKSAGKVTINAKKNATKDTLVISGIEEKVTVGKEITVSLPRVGKDSDERRLFLDDKALTENAKAPRTYTLKFTKADDGKHTLKAEAFQSAKLDAATATAEFEFEVVEPTPVEVKQTAYNAFQVTFEDDIEALGYYKDTKDWDQNGIANRVYYKINNATLPFSSVKVSSPKEKVLTVTMYGNFIAGTTYYVDIAGKTFQFEAAGNKAKDVTEIKFTRTTGVVQTNDSIEYKLYNKLGIDITATALADTNYSLMFSSDSTKAFVSGETIWFNEVGDTAIVKGLFTYYDPDNNYNAVETKVEAQFVGVAAATANYVGANYTLDNPSWFSYDKSDVDHTYKIGDTRELKVIARFKLNNTNIDVPLNGELPNGKTLLARVADQHFAMLSGADMIGVNTGRTSFVLYYLNDAGNEVVIDSSLVFDVLPARKATSIKYATATSDNTQLPYVNTWNGGLGYDGSMAADSFTVKVMVLDQYGDYIDDPFTMTYRDQCKVNSTYTGATASNDKNWYTGNFVTIDGTAFTNPAKECSAVFDIKTNSGLKTVVSFNIKACSYATVTRQMVNANRSNIDTKLTSNNNDAAELTTMQIVDLNQNYYVGKEPFALTNLAMDTTKPISFYDSYVAITGAPLFLAKISYNGTALGVTPAAASTAAVLAEFTQYQNNEYTVDLKNFIEVTAGALSLNINPYFDNSGWEKLAKGNYTVNFYKLVGVEKSTGVYTTDIQYLGAKSLVVDDTQKIPTFKQDKQTYTASSVVDAIRECYTFYDLDGNKITDETKISVSGYNYKVNGTELYVYSAVVTLQLKDHAGTAKDYRLIVPIGELLTKAN